MINVDEFYLDIDRTFNGKVSQYSERVPAYSIEMEIMVNWLYEYVRKAMFLSEQRQIGYYVYFVNSTQLQNVPGTYLYVGPDKPQDDLPWEILDPRPIRVSVGSEQYQYYFHNNIMPYLNRSPVLRNLIKES